MKLLNRINNFLTNLSTLKFIITLTAGMFLSSIILGTFFDLFNFTFSSIDSSISQASLPTQFIFAVVVSPLLETLLFQSCIIKLLRKITLLKNNDLLVILLSALIFGLQHFYDIGYIINTTILGIFLSYAFVTYEKKAIEKKLMSPFCITCIIHSLKNLISFIIVLILELV